MNARIDDPTKAVGDRFLELMREYDTPGMSDEAGCLAVVRAYGQIEAEFGKPAVDEWGRRLFGRLDPAEGAALREVERAYQLPDVPARRSAMEALVDAPGLAGGVARRFLAEAV
ncbi:hypothetical protein DMH04_41445 [Kibdelosporangium aridum]|uniref:Uncharacterized protein n=1 Tax=Kibdelosporangium aridum TaxID=2030 RepID=A0A428YV21_KIBAR|nr:hypothetical protein [Kibdelosporangium aridum]RSM73479.1 hypothetical protein DMH04_41445 [Kibdelosporangium aridum]